MPQNQDVTPTGPGFRASHGADKSSPPKASIPNAAAIQSARKAMGRSILTFADDNHGRAVESAIYRMNNSEIARCYLRLVAAQAIEAGTATTEGRGPKDESAVAATSGDAS